jgi:hypothetical protein
MSRMIQARVTDDQYDWVVDRAADQEGDLSAAIRSAIDMARVLNDVLLAPDPAEALREVLRRSDEEPPEEEAEVES